MVPAENSTVASLYEFGVPVPTIFPARIRLRGWSCGKATKHVISISYDGGSTKPSIDVTDSR